MYYASLKCATTSPHLYPRQDTGGIVNVTRSRYRYQGQRTRCRYHVPFEEARWNNGRPYISTQPSRAKGVGTKSNMHTIRLSTHYMTLSTRSIELPLNKYFEVHIFTTSTYIYAVVWMRPHTKVPRRMRTDTVSTDGNSCAVNKLNVDNNGIFPTNALSAVSMWSGLHNDRRAIDGKHRRHQVKNVRPSHSRSDAKTTSDGASRVLIHAGHHGFNKAFATKTVVSVIVTRLSCDL